MGDGIEHESKESRPVRKAKVHSHWRGNGWHPRVSKSEFRLSTFVCYLSFIMCSLILFALMRLDRSEVERCRARHGNVDVSVVERIAIRKSRTVL